MYHSWMSNSNAHTRRAVLGVLGGGTAMLLSSNPVGADESEATPLKMHENIDDEESESQDPKQEEQYPTPECKVIRPTDHGRRKMPEQ